MARPISLHCPVCQKRMAPDRSLPLGSKAGTTCPSWEALTLGLDHAPEVLWDLWDCPAQIRIAHLLRQGVSKCSKASPDLHGPLPTFHGDCAKLHSWESLSHSVVCKYAPWSEGDHGLQPLWALGPCGTHHARYLFIQRLLFATYLWNLSSPWPTKLS